MAFCAFLRAGGVGFFLKWNLENFTCIQDLPFSRVHFAQGQKTLIPPGQLICFERYGYLPLSSLSEGAEAAKVESARSVPDAPDTQAARTTIASQPCGATDFIAHGRARRCGRCRMAQHKFIAESGDHPGGTRSLFLCFCGLAFTGSGSNRPPLPGKRRTGRQEPRLF